MSTVMNRVEVIKPQDGTPLNVLGAPVLLKSMGEDRMFIADHPLPPGYAVPPHVHDDEDELFYILEGELLLVSDDGEATAGPGSFVHLPRGVKHGFANVTEKPTRMLAFTTPSGNLGRLFVDLDRLAREEPGQPSPQRVATVCAANRIRFA